MALVQNPNAAQGLRIQTIEKIIDETPTIKTFLFKDDRPAVGGQFVMVWIPGVDEIPMSVSYLEPKGMMGISVAKVGDATARMHDLQPGAKIGIRGPYGNGFDTGDAKRLLLIGGGCGSAPLGPVLERVMKEDKYPDTLFAVGARTSNELLFKSRALALGIEVDVSTDDGSEGYHGFVTERVEQLLDNREPDLVLACGPEVMLKKVAELAEVKKVQAQLSLERFMKCGVGICDSCSSGGYQVCRDGPLFKGSFLLDQAEFGTTARDACGRRIDI